MSSMHLGIDLGGTKIEAAVLDATGNFKFRERIPTPQNDYQATLNGIESLVMLAESALNETVTAIGIGHPGSIHPRDGRIRNANSTCLNGKPLQADLQSLLTRPITLANDADCLVLSEATDGAARDYRSVFGVILGTGVGGGWVIDGRLLQGLNGLSGEWGHNPLPIAHSDELPGSACYCGKYGCIEAWLSGPGLVADYQRHSADDTIKGVPALVNAAAQRNLHAQQALDRHTQRLARALAVIINAVDPEAVVLGGGVSQRPGLINDLYAALPAHIFLPFGTPLQTKILLPAFGDSSGVRGAARLT